MSKKRCSDCGGSGRVMGGGMINHDCDTCFGSGKVEEINNEIDYLEIKNTEAYSKAKKRLKKKHVELSDDEADKLLSEAFEKESSNPINGSNIISRTIKKVNQPEQFIYSTIEDYTITERENKDET